MSPLFKNRITNNITIHTLVWFGYILYELAIVLPISVRTVNLWETGFNFLLYALLFYCNAEYLLPQFYKRKKYVTYVVIALLVLAFYAGLRFVTKMYVIPFFNPNLAYPLSSLDVFMAEAVWRGGYFFMLSIGYWIAKNLITSERQRSLLQQQALEDNKRMFELEKSYQQAEIAALRNQINPHFLFNTLNFLYDQSRSCSSELAKGIMLLSKTMRYSIKDHVANSKVMLDEEIEHINNLISINRLRFGEKLQLDFHITGNTKFRMIAPLLLITFVENCFKYGEQFDADHPIVLHLEVTNDELVFKTYNKKRRTVEESTGIGLKNTIKRLNLIYSDRYELKIDDQEHTYELYLNLKI